MLYYNNSAIKLYVFPRDSCFSNLKRSQKYNKPSFQHKPYIWYIYISMYTEITLYEWTKNTYMNMNRLEATLINYGSWQLELWT